MAGPADRRADPRRGRRPGAAAGLLSLGIGVAALTLVAAAAYAFRGAIVGSLLGDTVSLSVRGADTVVAIVTVLLGSAAVDVLYLNIRDRAAELATLQAIGRRRADPARRLRGGSSPVDSSSGSRSHGL